MLYLDFDASLPRDGILVREKIRTCAVGTPTRAFEAVTASIHSAGSNGPGDPGCCRATAALGANTPWGLEFRAALVSALKAGSPTPLVIYSEILDLARFNSPQYAELLRTYLREKYQDKPIGVIIAHGATALEILLRFRAELWSSVPVVFGSVDSRSLPRLPPDVTGTTFRLTMRNAVTAARALCRTSGGLLW